MLSWFPSLLDILDKSIQRKLYLKELSGEKVLIGKDFWCFNQSLLKHFSTEDVLNVNVYAHCVLEILCEM